MSKLILSAVAGLNAKIPFMCKYTNFKSKNFPALENPLINQGVKEMEMVIYKYLRS